MRKRQEAGGRPFRGRDFLCALGSSLLAASLGAADLALTEDGFIPADVLFQDYDYLADATISPDGRYLVGQRLKEVGGGDHWLVTFTWDFQDRELTILSQGRDDLIRSYAFSHEDQLVYAYYAWRRSSPWSVAPPEGGESRTLIPTSEAVGKRPNKHLAGAVLVSPLRDDPDHVLFATRVGYQPLAARRADGEERLPGLWKVNTRTGEATLMVEAAYPTLRWWLNAAGEPALAETISAEVVRERGGFEEDNWVETAERTLYLIEDGRFGRALPLEPGPLQNDRHRVFLDGVFSADGSRLYYLSQATTDRLAIMEMDLATLTSKVHREEPRDDIVKLLVDPYRRELIGYRTDGGRGREVYFDRSLAGLQQAMEEVFPEEAPRVADWDRRRMRFLIEVRSARTPGRTYLFDRETMSVNPVMDKFEELSRYPLSEMEVVRYMARDGLEIEGYLTRPQRLGSEGPYPLILYVHGGPWARDRWGFDEMVQFLADRGYAVLQVNFRGSEGYGRSFLDAGDKEWGRAMQDDLTDAVEWAIAEGITTRERVAIMGESYGGYATLAGLVFTPELYRAGIAGMGVYDLTDHTETFRHYWGEGSDFVPDVWRRRIGDEEADAELLRAASPIYFLERVQAPVFVFHGKEDATVRVDQSFELVRRLRRLDKTVERSYLGGTGHSYGSEDRRVDLANEIEAFLRAHFPSDLMR